MKAVKAKPGRKRAAENDELPGPVKSRNISDFMSKMSPLLTTTTGAEEAAAEPVEPSEVEE